MTFIIDLRHFYENEQILPQMALLSPDPKFAVNGTRVMFILCKNKTYRKWELLYRILVTMISEKPLILKSFNY